MSLYRHLITRWSNSQCGSVWEKNPTWAGGNLACVFFSCTSSNLWAAPKYNRIRPGHRRVGSLGAMRTTVLRLSVGRENACGDKHASHQANCRVQLKHKRGYLLVGEPGLLIWIGQNAVILPQKWGLPVCHQLVSLCISADENDTLVKQRLVGGWWRRAAKPTGGGVSWKSVWRLPAGKCRNQGVNNWKGTETQIQREEIGG